MTQNPEHHSLSETLRPLPRTDLGGLRPVDFPRLIDAIQLRIRMRADAPELKDDAPGASTVSRSRLLGSLDS